MAVASDQGSRGIGAAGWVRGPAFDALLLGGTALLAVVGGVLGGLDSSWFLTVLLANSWLLGYHHVIATYTRIAFDSESARRHSFLLFGLPFVTLGVVLAVYHGLGVWPLATIYLHWQWFHYMRQSYGVEQIYWRRAAGAGTPRDQATWAVLYAVPVWGIVHRSAQQWPKFLGLDVAFVPVAPWVETAVAAVALGTIAYWLAVRVGEALRGELRVAHTLYVISHIGIFMGAYILIEQINPGWLLINIWHNAQYLLIVWMFNTNRFKTGIDPDHRFLSTLSQPRNVGLYAAACLTISTLFYQGAFELIEALPVAAFGATMIFSQAVNFHHYTVDAVVWKLRKPSVAASAGAVASG